MGSVGGSRSTPGDLSIASTGTAFIIGGHAAARSSEPFVGGVGLLRVVVRRVRGWCGVAAAGASAFASWAACLAGGEGGDSSGAGTAGWDDPDSGWSD